MKLSRRSPLVRAALRRLGNPYASLQIGDEVEVDDDFEVLTDEQHTYIHRLENQYAILSVALRAPEKSAEVSAATEEQPLSKADFDKECRRIFRPYIPALEKGRLRPHHRDFITRNHS